MNVHARAFATVFLLSSLLTAGRALAEPSTDELTTARHSFEEAVALEGEQKWAEAIAKLHQALTIKDTPGLRFHLAHCEERQGLLLEAAADYDRATELIQRGAKAPDVQKLLAPASADVKKRAPRLTVELPADVTNPVVLLDGKPAAPSELAQEQLLNPGAHELRVSAAGRKSFVRQLSLKEGDHSSIQVDLPESIAPTPSPVPVANGGALTPIVDANAPAPRARASAKPYLLAGEAVITAAGLALGIGYAVAASSAQDRVASAQSRIDHAVAANSSACSMPGAALGGACADLRSAIDDHDRDTTLSAVGFIGAGVGAAALLTTALVFPSSHARTSELTLEPTFSWGRLGIRGRF